MPKTQPGYFFSNGAPSTGQSNSPKRSSVMMIPDGVEALANPSDATADICFVHDLTGDRTSTWTAHKQPTPWPKTLLPLELPQGCRQIRLTIRYINSLVGKG
ncbi:Nitrate reductase [Fusarium oxysporum f. sp. albedinis]|nr:Nitrate reductase [Fusarium oxysporum f. sp. albedinis]